MSAPLRAGNSSALHARLQARLQAQVKAIKASQRQLQMDDTTYRDMLQALTGQRSATELNQAQAAKVLDYLRRQGAVNPKADRHSGKRRPVPAPDRAAMVAKVHALLGALGEATGQPHGMAYADAICKRNGWAEAVDFCGPLELHDLIGALSRTLRRRQAGQTPPATSPDA